MKLLYAARIARFDLLRSINTLARNVTKWSIQDDAKLYHLMCYVNSTLGKRMIGWVGNDMKDLSIALYADADFADVHNHCEVHFRFSYAYSGETYSVSTSWWEQTPGMCEPFYT